MPVIGRKYDDAGWHIDSGAVPDHLPPEFGMVHIAAYFAWIIRRGWYDPEFVGDDDAEAVRQREPGAALRVLDSIEGKLGDEEMTGEAAAFSTYYYDQYLVDWGTEFRDFALYAVPDVPQTHIRADRLLDRRYNEWVRRGRPQDWRPLLSDRIRRFARPAAGYVLVFATTLTVALLGAVLDLRTFPWPLIQVAIVVAVFFWLAWHDWL